ncbi:hypothetical protein AWENTII_010599 [Aspergillus wentii]
MLQDILSIISSGGPLPFVATGLALVVTWGFYTTKVHSLSKFPGPLGASLSRLWIFLHVLTGKAEKRERRLHEKYGPIVRIAPDELSISDPQAMKIIYGTNTGFTKTDFYTVWKPTFVRHPDHFASLDEKVHSERRKIVNPVYSMSSIVESEEYIDKCVALFLEQLDGFADRKEVLDFSTWARLYAFDVIGELYFSNMFGFMKNQGDVDDYIYSLDTLVPIMALASIMPVYTRPLFLYGGALFFPSIKRGLKSLAAIDREAGSCVEERLQSERGGKPQRRDILRKLFEIWETSGVASDFEQIDIKAEIYSALLAGSDTTATALSSTMHYLVKDRRVYAKLTEEIDEETQKGNLSPGNIRYSEATKLQYLCACVKEGMRMNPSVSFTLPRHVPKEGCEMAGFWIPGGTKVGMNAAVLHFDKGVFGEDAAEYRPERWLEPGAETMNRYMLHVWLPCPFDHFEIMLMCPAVWWRIKDLSRKEYFDV